MIFSAQISRALLFICSIILIWAKSMVVKSNCTHPRQSSDAGGLLFTSLPLLCFHLPLGTYGPLLRRQWQSHSTPHSLHSFSYTFCQNGLTSFMVHTPVPSNLQLPAWGTLLSSRHLLMCYCLRSNIYF